MPLSPFALRFLFGLLAPWFVAAAALAAEAAQAHAAPRATYNFNPDWRVFVGDAAGADAAAFDDSAWKAVTLPHAWNEDHAFRVAINRMPTGIAWYRKTFRLPAHASGQKIFLEFEGARQAAEVWLNGRLLGLHENGVTAFGFDISDHVRPAPQDNVVAVRTDNSYRYQERATQVGFQWNHTSFNVAYGGLTKNLHLHVTGRLYQTLPLFTNLGTTGVYVYALDHDIPGRAATVHVESEVRNEHAEPRAFTLQAEVRDRDGRVVSTFRGEPQTIAAGATLTATASARVEGLHFWSWGYGYLYDVVTTLVADGAPVDAVTTRTGFRKTAFTGGMLTLNDRPLHLKGYAQRSSNEWPALGSSVPGWLSDYGNHLMVESGANLVRWMHITPARAEVESCDRVGLIQALPAGDSEKDVTGRQWEHRLEVMRDATIYHRNNPSVIFYEAGNKGITEEHMRDMRDIRDRFDPRGGRAAGSREMLGSKIAEWGGEMLYVNKSAGKPLWQTEYSRDEGLRKYWDEFSPPYHKNGDGPLYRDAPAPAYNHNQDSHAIENIRRWYDFWRERPGTGHRVNGGGVNIIFSDTNSHFRGAENYRRSGEVDAMRIPKDGFYAHQIMWNGWVDVERPGIRILGHWNYASDVTKDVFVVSSADSVELLLNGRSLGRGEKSLDFLHTFKAVAWQPGELRAVGRDAAGASVCEFAHVTAGPPVALRLTPVPRPFEPVADASDVVLVEVEVVDAAGRRCPTALDLVEFTLEGPAEWRGGIAQGPDNHILSRRLPVECGVNRVLVRTTREPGAITLTARSGALAPATVGFVSRPFAVTAGLATRAPSAGLPGRLDRGPTPSGPAFRTTRVSVPVLRATANENSGTAGQAFDDDETTAWIGRGSITFELARPARLHEITARLAGFRARSYPLRIRVDDTEVWFGMTPRSLGYVTLALKPSEGRRVTIEGLGAAEAKEAFAGIRELVDQGNATTGEENVRDGQVGIFEIEFHEPAPPPPPAVPAPAPAAAATAAPAAPTVYHFDFGPGPAREGHVKVPADAVYSTEGGHGFDFDSRPGGTGPFFFSVRVPEGNYRVTVTLGDADGPSRTTIRTEAGHLMAAEIATAAGEFITRSFIANVRRPELPSPPRNAPGATRVHMFLPGEAEARCWDEKLTIEFNHELPRLAALTVERVDDLPTLFVAGDSTVGDPRRGPGGNWPTQLCQFLRPDIALCNSAEGGETTKSFLTGHRLDKVLSRMKAGDFFLIQFGHNDSKAQWPQSYTEPGTTFEAYLGVFIAETRRRGATPVFVTPMERRANGDSVGPWARAMKAVAARENVPLIDQWALSKQLWTSLGERVGEAFSDQTHLSGYGGYLLSRLIATEIRRTVPELARHLVADLEPMDPAQPAPAPAYLSQPAEPSRGK